MIDYIKQISTFNLGDFHFLRPEWLWAFAPAIFATILVLIASKENKKWKDIIAPALRPFMFTKAKSSVISSPVINYLIIISICILGVSGPAWNKVEVPGSKSEAVLMIAMDASHSMLAEDVQPSRLERAKFKVKDLLNANPGSRVSLYAYAGTPHTVVPFCSDYKLITHHLESLTPGIMPIQGSNLEGMMALADSVFHTIKAPSTLLIVTDTPEEKDVAPLINFVESTPHRLEILAIGTPQGTTIPKNKYKTPLKDKQGNVVISKLDSKVLLELETHPKIHINTLTLDNSDMVALAQNIKENLDYQANDEESEEEWQDMGYLAVILLAFLFPLWFRKGWMLQYAWIPVVLCMFPSCGKTSTWEDLWYTKDYQGQLLYEEQEFEDAGNTFETPYNQGVAYFKSGNYDAASQAFEKDSSSNSLYNLGLSYTKLGRYDDALKVITLASELEPGNAMFEKAKEQAVLTIGIIDSLQGTSEILILAAKEEEKKDPFKEIKPKTKDEELSSDNEVEELPEDGERITDEVETDQRKGEEQEELPEDFESGEGNSPQNILVRAISDDPSEFLRRRFKYQSKIHYSNIESSAQSW